MSKRDASSKTESADEVVFVAPFWLLLGIAIVLWVVWLPFGLLALSFASPDDAADLSVAIGTFVLVPLCFAVAAIALRSRCPPGKVQLVALGIAAAVTFAPLLVW